MNLRMKIRKQLLFLAVAERNHPDCLLFIQNIPSQVPVTVPGNYGGRSSVCCGIPFLYI